MCNITLPLIGLFKWLAHHLCGDGWQWCRGDGGARASRWVRRDVRCRDEARTSCHITENWHPINTRDGHASPAHFVSLSYTLHLVFVPWRLVVWEGVEGEVFLISTTKSKCSFVLLRGQWRDANLMACYMLLNLMYCKVYMRGEPCSSLTRADSFFP